MIPPDTDTVQSAPDVFGNIVFSASIANSKIWFLSSFENKLDIDNTAATQHADDEPRPAPIGISDCISISIPLLKLFSLIIFFAMMKNGLNILSMLSNDSEIAIVFSPKDDLIKIF